MSQAKLSQVEAERGCEVEEKEAALKRVAELEASNAELAKLKAELSELARQLEAATASRQTQQKELEELRRLVEDLEERNSALVASCAAAEEREAVLQVCNCLP